MKKYDEMINELVEIEMDESSHDDSPEDYNSKLEFYLSNAERDSYIDYIKSNYNVTTEEATEIQDEVIAEIKKRYEAIQLAASMAGRKGGKSKSAAKVKASAENGKKGGRPKMAKFYSFSDLGYSGDFYDADGVKHLDNRFVGIAVEDGGAYTAYCDSTTGKITDQDIYDDGGKVDAEEVRAEGIASGTIK